MPTTQEIFNEQQVARALPRLAKVAAWYEKGLGASEIAKLLGLKRQRAWSLIQRAKGLGLIKNEAITKSEGDSQ